MTMTLTAILQNCMRILQLLLRRDMDARTPLPALRNKTDPSVRRIRWTSRCHSARFLSSSGVLFSSLGRLSNCARDGTKSNRALAVALAESVPCIAALSHSYKLKLVARKSKYIEHIQIQPARRPPCDHQSCARAMSNVGMAWGCRCAVRIRQCVEWSMCTERCARPQHVYTPRTHKHTRREEDSSLRGCNEYEMLVRAHMNLSPAVVVFAVPGRKGR